MSIIRKRVDQQALRIAFVGDAGEPGAVQTSVARRLKALAPKVDEFWFLGDNVYDSTLDRTTIKAAWREFFPIIKRPRSRFRFVLGNHDMDDGDSLALQTMALLGGVTNNRRYYGVQYGGPGGAIADVWALNSGQNSAAAITEPDGRDAASIQAGWLVSHLRSRRLNNPRAWQIAAFHHPPITTVASKAVADMDWDWSAIGGIGMDLILCGHAHGNEVLTIDGVPLWNISYGSRAPDTMDQVVDGATGGALVWQDLSGTGDTSVPAVGYLVATPRTIKLTAIRASDGHPLYEQTIHRK